MATKFNPLIMGSKFLERNILERLRSQFGRNVSFYWCRDKAPINVLRGRKERFILETPAEYEGEVFARADGSLKIILSIEERTDGMNRFEKIELY